MRFASRVPRKGMFLAVTRMRATYLKRAVSAVWAVESSLLGSSGG